MKAFVIKNKEGKYLAVSSSNYEHYWTTIDFAHYFRFLGGTHDAKQEAEEFRNTRYPECEVVEITIAEGDLEKELAEKDKRIDELEQEREFMLEEVKNRATCGLCEKLENEQIKELNEQLAEKDKEIEKLSSALDYWENNLPNQRQAIKKQVCEEIREKILTRLELPKEEWVWCSDNYVGVDLIKEILDKIEQAKEGF